MRARLLVLALALSALLGAVASRLAELERGSTARQGGSMLEPGETELVHATRPSGTEVVVEVCSSALAEPQALDGVRFALLDGRERGAAFDRTIDPATVRRGPHYSCARLASAAPGIGGSDLRIVARTDRRVAAIVAGRIVTRRPLAAQDGWLVLGLAIVGLALLIVIVRDEPRAAVPESSEDSDAAPEPPSPAASAPITVAVAVGLVAIAFAGTMWLPIGGTRGGLVRGAMLLAAQLLAVAFAIPRDARIAFGFVRPERFALALGLAPIVAIGVRLVARGASAVLPSTGPSAVARLAAPSAGLQHPETILDPRSGILAIAAIAIVAPIVEELFFRGVVYGALERWKGTKTAAVSAALLFVLAHVPQTIGEPAAIVSIAVLSVAATAMRARFGSVAAPAAMHFTHNAILVIVGLVASR